MIAGASIIQTYHVLPDGLKYLTIIASLEALNAICKGFCADNNISSSTLYKIPQRVVHWLLFILPDNIMMLSYFLVPTKNLVLNF